MLPFIVTGIAVGKFHPYLTREDFCWISTDRGLIWLFVGPVLFIIFVNTTILTLTLRTSYKMSIEESEFDKLRNMARLTLILMPIFGATWLFGVLAVNEQLIMFQYVFTVVNSLQGVYIFICYCLLNNDVKREYGRIKNKSTYVSYSSSEPISSSTQQPMITPLKVRRFKRSLSTEEHAPPVELTKFHPTYPGYPGFFTPINETTALNSEYFDPVKSQDKGFSVELMQLQPNGVAGHTDEYSLNPSYGKPSPARSRGNSMSRSSRVVDENPTPYSYGSPGRSRRSSITFLDTAPRADEALLPSENEPPMIRTFSKSENDKRTSNVLMSYQV